MSMRRPSRLRFLNRRRLAYHDFLFAVQVVTMTLKEAVMNQPIAFADVLEAAEHLDPEAQAELVAVINRRLAERGRQRIADSIEQARREYSAGQCKPMTAGEIMKEAYS
jgi:hypothetical protein